MKLVIRNLTCVALLGLLALTGCGPKEESSSGNAESDQTTAVAPDISFEITGNDQMKFNRTQLSVTPGAVVQIKLTNVGKMPAQAMSHNWILLHADADVEAFATAAATERTNNYFPAAKASEVIAHTRMLGPGESDTITFTAPTEAGDYAYLCTFPGHFMAGMKGTFTVKAN